jgi:two-component system response regulator
MKGQILLVEDDLNDVFFMQQAMRKAGIVNPVQVATDGQKAIHYLEGTGAFSDRDKFPLPCLVILDLKLPIVMGLDVLKWIRMRPELGVPVIILSASSNEADIEAAYRLGANAYLVKPNAVEKLVAIARSIKEFWLVHNTPPTRTAI